MPVNACHDTSLPADYGTNFPVPSDPNGFGFANQSVIGWEGNWYAPFAYLSGSYFARGVPDHYVQRGTTYCGAMYSFGIYTYGLAQGAKPAAGSVTWTMADGYLPAMTTSFTRDNLAVNITDFADKISYQGSPVELVYTRVTARNQGTSTVTADPGATGQGLLTLASQPDTLAPGAQEQDDYVAAVDVFGSGKPLPTLTAGTVPDYNTAYRQMANFWNARLDVIPRLTLPNTALPNTNNLADPGTAMDNAYKAAFVYTRIVQSGTAPFSGANNYDWLLNHDLPGILGNRFELGDFTDAQNLLLDGRISEASNFDEKGANWYWDGPWRTPVAWADYLQATDDTQFVNTYFHDDANGPSQWGPSLYTLMHTDYLAQLDATTGYLQASFDNDSGGVWLFDDETALAGLSAYKYIATKIGNQAEAQWAQTAYTSLLNAVNKALAANESANNFNFLPCEVNAPITTDRCDAPNDANWASQALWGENQWDILLQGGDLNGVLGDPTQTDNLYQLGFARLDGTGVPFPSFGAYNGYSVALNTGYSAAALYGNAYRDLPITSYAWQIATTTGGPNAWWEANGSAPDPNNPWQGSHAAPEFGAVPYAWPMAGQTETLLQSLAALGRTSDGQPVLYIGRGVPDQWLGRNQTIAVDNLTASYDVNTGHRATYGVRMDTLFDGTVHVTLSGQVPTQNVQVQLPAFASQGVRNVIGGRYDPATHTVTMNGRSVNIQLGNSAKPTLTISVASTVAGQHSQPSLTAGMQTTATTTITNSGHTTIGNIQLSLPAPTGWTVAATTPTAIASLAPGQAQTVTWNVTPPADGNGGQGLVIQASYTAPDNASGTVSAEQWVHVQKPLPLPPGATDLALTATASASYTSPWTTVSAINNGIYPVQSSDDNNLTPYWGCWPQTGTQWVELDWTSPVTTNGSDVYFADDGGGLRLPTSWSIQYWNGSAFVDVPAPSAYQAADNTFNHVSFGSVTTTKLRIEMLSGPASYGVIQWVVPSIPSN
ncbi:MAG TPA: NEW3 domain-containing protein [Streptosporangiaceae bacterium]|nr:NEW3 domain-containing protein [Streptosporangiaceae bacterium]